MELHEYQAKLLLARFGVPSPPHTIVEAGCNVSSAISKFSVEPLIVKAQVHGKGRKEGGGEIAVESPKELVEAVTKLLGSKITTSESGPEGFAISKVMVMSAPSAVQQYQVKIFLASGGSVCVAVSQEGGKVFTEHPFEGVIRPFQLGRLAASLRLRGEKAAAFTKLLEGTVRAFFYFDALLLSIDSLILTENGLFQAVDVRMVIDDRALYRQPEVVHMIDSSQVGPRNRTPPYICVGMGGTIGCLGNGLGLALSTADLVCLLQGVPGKVVNIGSELDESTLVKGIRMLHTTAHRVLFINLFTGLLDGEKVADILKQEVATIPMVVRLEGMNGAGGRRLLQGLEPLCIVTDSLDEAARLVVK